MLRKPLAYKSDSSLLWKKDLFQVLTDDLFLLQSETVTISVGKPERVDGGERVGLVLPWMEVNPGKGKEGLLHHDVEWEFLLKT